MKFKVTLQVTLEVDRDLEHYNLEEEKFENEDAIVEALKEQIEDEITGDGYAYFISEHSLCEDNTHSIEYLSET